MKKSLLVLALLLAICLAVVGCQTATPTPTASPTAAPTVSADPLPLFDRAGNAIVLPENIERIICASPPTTEMLVDLGLGDKLIGVDKYSLDVAGIPEDLLIVDMNTPDAEAILAARPDVIIYSGMTLADGEDSYKPLSDAGVVLVCIPSSDSIEGIREDMRFVAAAMGVGQTGSELIHAFDAEIARIAEIGKTITEKRTVYFEISPAPYLYSFGRNTFLNEMIEIIGAQNVFGDQDGWISVSDEVAVAANPYIILTNVTYVDDPVSEIKGRPGWDALGAVQNGRVHTIDANASSRSNTRAVQALIEMASAVYPEYYGQG